MPSYNPPIRDMKFIVHELWDIQKLLNTLPAFNNVDYELIDPIIEEAARICRDVIFPINYPGDKQGCHFENGTVLTPKGYKEAYQSFVEGGWMGLSGEPEYGGQGLPKMLQALVDEMTFSSSIAFGLYTMLTHGACHALAIYGSEETKKTYLHKLVSGEWAGTMCLTESHAGTDLGLIRTKAEKQADGSYHISGTKIFITSGEHDLTENIIHMVLARTTDAPAGIKGISLFLIPKFLVNADGSLGARNQVQCGSIEHKMGIKASSTCVMNFENATGYLVGEENKGMVAMFSMMNMERLNVGLQGLGLAETAYQNALIYAKERLQGQAIGQRLMPEKAADPIIVHPDVRRMLLTIKAYNEGARALAAWVAMHIDISNHAEDTAIKQQAADRVALLTPVVKAFFTDYGFDACNLALQIFGGHGFIAETGVEQYVRDARIPPIYEGANGIQALDLLKRKVLLDQGKMLNDWLGIMRQFISENKTEAKLQEFVQPLTHAIATLEAATLYIQQQATTDPAAVGAASVDYLKLLALVSLAYMWATMAKVALTKIDQVEDEETVFYNAKLHTGRFYMQRLLPQIATLKQTIESGSGVLMDLEIAGF